MLTAEGCRQRRLRLWERLGNLSFPRLALADRVHLTYLANANFDPISLAADMPAVLLIAPDGKATLVVDRRSPHSVDTAYVDEVVKTDWYPGSTPGQGPRQLALDAALGNLGVTGLHDCFGSCQHDRRHATRQISG
jgi:hypothetical protein